MEKNRLIIGYPAALYDGILRENTLHSHHSIQILFDCPGMVYPEEREEPVSCRHIILSPGLPHRVDTEGQRVLSLLIEPESPLGWALFDRYLGEEPYSSDPEGLVPPGDNHDDPSEELETVLYSLHLLISEKSYQEVHPAVERAMNILRSNTDRIPSVGELACEAGISESRLVHLFGEYPGVPVDRYILWQRIRKAVEYAAARGEDLTTSSHLPGFADSARLSRTFRRFFGYSPSSILKDGRNVQVHFV